jgi:hypothetical protein
MSNHIDHLAHVSVARGCGFALIALVTTVVGLSSQMPLALATGGVLCLIACFVLTLKAVNARRQDYRRTELWLMLEPRDRPNAAVAQRLIAIARRDALLEFALRAAWLAAGQFVASLLWQAFLSG